MLREHGEPRAGTRPDEHGRRRLRLGAREPSVPSECPHPLEDGIERLLVAPGRHGDAEALVAGADLLTPQQPEPVRELVRLALARRRKAGRRHLHDREVVPARPEVGKRLDDRGRRAEA